MDRRVPGFPGNPRGTDYIRKILEQCMVARAPGEDSNLVAVRSHRCAICIKMSDAFKASVAHVDEEVVKG
jgi:hypothetical protein